MTDLPASLSELFSNTTTGDWILDGVCNQPDNMYSPDEYFVPAGSVINPERLNDCRRCPVRSDCLELAYKRDRGHGYYGGTSAGQRKNMTFDEALLFIATDKADTNE